MATDALSENYQMLEELGSGSFGTVYKAIEKATGEIVAVKNIDLESTDEDLVEVQAEISLLSTCASPFVTQYKASFLCGYKLWIVMEYLGGGSCQDLLKPGVFSEAHIAIVCQQILLGLDYLHQEGKLHRDIKAANILLSQSGKVKLADFGVAAQLVNIRSLRNTFVGTPFWMAPEVIEQSGYDFKADIWSLGITAVELIHGEPPGAGKHPMKVLMEIPKVPAPRLEGTRYSRDFKDFVAKCLVKNPDQRASAKELLKHRFIRNAGRTEALQELILRRQEWEAGLENKASLKYYAETMRSIKAPVHDDEDDNDDWVFDTIKAIPTIHTQKRRKLTRLGSEDEGRDDEPTNRMEDLETSTSSSPSPPPPPPRHFSTMRKVPDQPVTPSSSQTAKRSNKKRISSGQRKQPLGVNMSFGNSPSTVRQFRRVSPSSIENGQPDKYVDVTPSSLSPTKARASAKPRLGASTETTPRPLPSAKTTTRSPGRHSSQATDITSSSAVEAPPAHGRESREARRGHHLYAQAIGASCQETLDTTADSPKRDALSHLAESFSNLEAVDPVGLYDVMMGIFKRVGKDEGLRNLLSSAGGTTATSGSVRKESNDVVEDHSQHQQPQPQRQREGTTRNSSDRQQTPSGERAIGGAAKLVLAQNNPHLKSHHRRRQSAHVLGTSSSSQASSAVRLSKAPLDIPSSTSTARQQLQKKAQARDAAAAVTKDSPRSAAALREAKLVKQEVRELRGALNLTSTTITSASGSSKRTNVDLARVDDGDVHVDAGTDVDRFGIDRVDEHVDDDDDDDGDDDASNGGNADIGVGAGDAGDAGGMEHVRLIGDVLFERWCEGLKSRWSGVGVGVDLGS